MRIADVFFPDVDGYSYNSVNFTGRWRRILVFGRGAGGSYYTAIDVTSPGPFTRKALQTDPPWVMWSRGNPDTVDGTAIGTPVRAADTATYATMGQSWSVPAVGNVDPRLSNEWRVFTGSGYGDTGSGNGKTFYQLDALTGDVVSSYTVPDGLSTYTLTDGNAIVAGPSAYNPRQLDPPGTTAPDPVDRVTRVFFPDIQGRIWKVTVNGAPVQGNFLDAGPGQPFANPVSLLKIDGVGLRLRQLGQRQPRAGLRGAVQDVRPQGPRWRRFRERGCHPRAPRPPSRSTSRRRDRLLSSSEARPSPRRRTTRPINLGFFEGTRFNPAGAASCQSSFDTILFAVRALSGGAAYDFNNDGTADMYTVFAQTKDMGIQVAGGSLYRSASGSLGAAPSPTPDPNPTPTPAPPKPAYIVQTALRSGSPVCRTP